MADRQAGEINGLRRIARFRDDFFSVHEHVDRLFATDLRMGREPDRLFRFGLGAKTGMR